MTGIVGVRRPGEARIAFVHPAHAGMALRPGQRVLVTSGDGDYHATVAIGAGQLIETSEPPAIEGVIVSVEAAARRPERETSREDAAYRARKAAWPPLGSRLTAGEIVGTVTRIDLRAGSLDIRTDGGEVVPARLADLNGHDPADR